MKLLLIGLSLVLLAGCASHKITPTPTAMAKPTVATITAEQKNTDEIKALTAKVNQLTADLDKANKLLSNYVTKVDLDKAIAGYASPAEVLDFKRRLAAVEGAQAVSSSQLGTYEAQINAAVKSMAARLDGIGGQWVTVSEWLSFRYNTLDPLTAWKTQVEARLLLCEQKLGLK